MFTHEDMAFLDRLGQRADAGLSASDPTAEQLHHAIDTLRASLRAPSLADPGALVEADALLDAVWTASAAGDATLARQLASRLARTVRSLDLPGARAMNLLDVAQQIRALVVLAA